MVLWLIKITNIARESSISAVGEHKSHPDESLKIKTKRRNSLKTIHMNISNFSTGYYLVKEDGTILNQYNTLEEAKEAFEWKEQNISSLKGKMTIQFIKFEVTVVK